jgi:hypothetical protein
MTRCIPGEVEAPVRPRTDQSLAGNTYCVGGNGTLPPLMATWEFQCLIFLVPEYLRYDANQKLISTTQGISIILA